MDWLSVVYNLADGLNWASGVTFVLFLFVDARYKNVIKFVSLCVLSQSNIIMGCILYKLDDDHSMVYDMKTYFLLGELIYFLILYYFYKSYKREGWRTER